MNGHSTTDPSPGRAWRVTLADGTDTSNVFYVTAQPNPSTHGSVGDLANIASHERE
jgi:hypothetical protein